MLGRRPRGLSAVAALFVTVLLWPARAQSQDSRGADEDRSPPAWAGDLVFASANAALGGLTAGVRQALRGKPFWPAFRDGALGGAVAYAGRRIAVEPFPGAGLLGREVAAVGTSVVRNTWDGRGALERIVLPIGPVRLYLRGDTASLLPLDARLKLDVATGLVTAYFVIRNDTEFDAGASLSAGAPVFTIPERLADGRWTGNQAAGVLWLRGNPDDPTPDVKKDRAAAHERVHVLQYDFSFLAWSDPLEGWVNDRMLGGGWMNRHLDFGLHLGAWGLANQLLPYDQRPWEHEAHFLSGVR